MRISQRIKQLDKMVNKHYAHIWDCCCDHGFLGQRLLQRQAGDNIHFVDIVEPLMQELSEQLERFFSAQPYCEQWQVHCLDVAKLPLTSIEENTRENTEINKASAAQLIIIAGVGGEQTLAFVKAITDAHPEQALEFLLCPVHHHYQLRCGLIEANLGLVDECLFKENKRFYEMLHVSTQSRTPISVIGSKMWDLTRSIDQQYLEKTIRHYQRMQLKSSLKSNSALHAYQALLSL